VRRTEIAFTDDGTTRDFRAITRQAPPTVGQSLPPRLSPRPVGPPWLQHGRDCDRPRGQLQLTVRGQL